MKTRKLITAVLTTLCFAVPASASAATRYAEPGGDGPFPCAESDPCDIQYAVEGQYTQNGDEIVLLSGTYDVGNDQAASLVITKALDVHGQAGEPYPVLNTGSQYGLFSNNAGAKLSRVRIEHSGTGAAFDFMFGRVDRVFAHTTSAGGLACSGQGIVISNAVCWAEGDHAAGLGRNQSGGTWTMHVRNVTAIGEGSLNNAAGIRLFDSTNADHALIAKNVIADSPGGDILTVTDASSKTTITLDHSSYSNAFSFGPGPVSITPPGSGTNQTAAPKFVDAAGGDFREAADSPTIDAGITDDDSGSFDLADAPRFDGLAPDIGAYEVADADDDDDAVADTADNCPLDANPDQADVDEDGIGDVCDPVDDRPVDPVTTPPDDQAPTDDPTTPVDATPPGTTPPDDQSPADEVGDADRAAPDTVIDSGPAKGTHKRRTRVRFHSTEPGSTFECSVDRGSYKPCASPLRLRVKGGRKHRLAVRAIDRAGNVDSTPAVVRWRVLAR